MEYIDIIVEDEKKPSENCFTDDLRFSDKSEAK